MSSRLTRGIFVGHGVVTLAAAVVLMGFPAAIPATVGVSVEPEEYLLSYFLGAAELGVGLLSLAAIRLHDAAAVRLIALCFAAFHGATAILEVVYVGTQGPSAVLVANIGLRVVVTIVFVVIARRRAA
ncbi:hypothetical protein [Herbiconiux sp. VKM Ac-2851]|uniref:hypothetical protein n=1 Tax=Herbiconiux sp. VKM Ac-2851 TaxID=2739025 RepID=UPI0015662AC0|nr:hypothetical protein [Herbiconiux sp. VKM Ac-2851]NQX34074.1 hypothetical protein [Herbiconiux sp. VKM Ac-2851]